MPGLAPEPPQVSHAVPLELDDLRRAAGRLRAGPASTSQWMSPPRAGAASASPAAEEIAEEALAEDVAEGLEDVADVVELRRPAARQAGVAVAVVAARFSGWLSTSKASAASLNLATASSSPGLRSG